MQLKNGYNFASHFVCYNLICSLTKARFQRVWEQTANAGLNVVRPAFNLLSQDTAFIPFNIYHDTQV
jgi:hypothetical protein